MPKLVSCASELINQLVLLKGRGPGGVHWFLASQHKTAISITESINPNQFCQSGLFQSSHSSCASRINKIRQRACLSPYAPPPINYPALHCLTHPYPTSNTHLTSLHKQTNKQLSLIFFLLFPSLFSFSNFSQILITQSSSSIETKSQKQTPPPKCPPSQKPSMKP